MKKTINRIKRFILNNTNIINVLFSIPFYLFRVFKVEKNKIFIVNYRGKGYGDNGKYIANELIKDNSEDYKIYWAVKNINNIKEFPNEITPIRINSLKYFFHLATSKIWINNSRFEPYVRKRKNQFYIQTWHSSLRLKKIEMDIANMLSKYYIKSIKNESKMIDLMICGSDFSYDTYRRAFLYNGRIEKIGTPRCDILFNKDFGNQIREKLINAYGIDKNKKIILYAPTFRDNSNNNEWMIQLEDLYSKIGNEYNILVRLHPNMKKNPFKESKSIIDVTDYPDMQELICAIDMLITDYSGCSFDMLIANKPCILYIPDLDEYLKKERELYFDIKSLPFCISYNMEQLINNIVLFDKKEYYKRVQDFSLKINLYENGNATKEICKIIRKVIKNEKV
jgi:CDP-glycerol glycerophosphotransferase